MAPVPRTKTQKPHKVVKPKKNPKFSTVSSRQHRFQSFTDRIAHLKIDPVRKRRHEYGQEELSGDESTYFGRSLREWEDVNLSEVFVAFAKEATPLCDSLPMVLHNEDKIMDLLVSNIQKREALAMEPLLALLSNFAHDLNSRFEKHFQRGVTVVLEVAASHPDPVVIEWSFTCLAWLFKYLSRLLTPDLRPLYNIMAPYLGRDSQKPFVVRFSAEAYSFLIRKAGTSYERNPQALDLPMLHMLRDCKSSHKSGHSQFYQDGIKTVLVEAMQGVQQSMHSNGLAVLHSLLKQTNEVLDGDDDVVVDIVCGTLTSLIHQTNAETFAPGVQSILLFLNDALQEFNNPRITLTSSVLFTLMSVRKGTRVINWKEVSRTMKALFVATDRFETIDYATASSVLGSLAVFIHTAPVDAVLALHNTLDALRTEKWLPFFLHVCDYVVRLNHDRFDSFLLPQFQKFVVHHWQDDSRAFLLLIPRMTQNHQSLKLKSPVGYLDIILDDIESLNGKNDSSETDTHLLGQLNKSLSTIEHFELTDDYITRLTGLLCTFIESALQSSITRPGTLTELAAGPALQCLLSINKDTNSITHLWPALCEISVHMFSSELFWANLLAFVERCRPLHNDGNHVDHLKGSLMRSLCLSSHPIRQNCLQILQTLFLWRNEHVPAAVTTAITIESIPINLENARSLSMHIRRLSSEHEALATGELMCRFVPTYCFGLLHLNLSQAWNDAIDVLGMVCQSKKGEEAVVQLAQSWLKDTPTSNEDPHTTLALDINSDGFKVFSDFECPNLAKLKAIREQSFIREVNGASTSHEQLSVENARVPVITSTARSQALKVLSKLPQVAEKRSRLLVPVLLSWANVYEADEPSNNRWSRKDQKALLSIFSQFVNPKVLYRSSEVHDALLALCMNGDSEIQQSALKAILAWKEPAVSRYEEHLNNLLDEARFREEISVFLNDETEDGIRPEDLASVMPVLLRLLYGRAVAGNKDVQTSRRRALFVAISRFGQETLGQYLDIALSPFVKTGLADDQKRSTSNAFDVKVSYRKQVGVLNMLNDMLGSLGAELQPFQPKLVDSILPCTAHASDQLQHWHAADGSRDNTMLRTIRQTGVQCLVKIFADMDWSGSDDQLRYILDNIVAPRVPAFAQENLQSVSGLLRLFGAWAGKPETAHYVYGARNDVIMSVASLLAETHAKDEVRIFILQNILDALLEEVRASNLNLRVAQFVDIIGTLIEQQPSKDVLDASVRTLTGFAPLVQRSDEATRLTLICNDLLTRPSRLVSPKTKTGLMQILLPLIEHFDIAAKDKLYAGLCGLFSRTQGDENRLLVSQTIVTLVRDDSQLSRVAQLCESLNAMGRRLDEPDHERREQAFAQIFDLWKTLTLQQWLPVVHNCMFYIRDGEDRVNRSSASHGLQLFVDAASEKLDDNEWLSLLENTIISAIERGMLESSELVRTEYLHLLGRLVEKCPSWIRIQGMDSLLFGGDDEASFFTNILHIQHHRRLRAVRRLMDTTSHLSSGLIAKLFLPLIEHFVFDPSEGDSGRTLSDQSVTCIGAMAKELNLSSLRATFKRYTGYLSSKEDLEKTVLRLLGALVDGYTQAVSETEADVDATSKRRSVIVNEMLPPLLKYLHQKDESTVDRRMPVAVTVVKLLLALPESDFRERLPAVLTDVSHVLRSRSQEARDQTRKTLTTISSLIGPSYFGFILKELRGALKRGYQLHVLSYTVHALLLDTKDLQQPGHLDVCLPDLMSVIMDDIFGATGQEKDAEEYKSTMKEVKSSKSFDSLELLARVIPIRRLGQVVRPIQALLCEKMDMKAIKKTDDLLIRLRKGLDQNSASDTRDMLAFCWEIVNEVYTANAAAQTGPIPLDERARRYIVQPEEPKKSHYRGAITSQLFKLFSFALNLVRKVVRRHEDLLTSANMAGFLPMIGDALVQGQEEVQLAAVKLLSTIMKVPLQELDDNAPMYVKEALAMVKGSVDINTDSAKAALELITTVLREKRTVEIRERDVATLLKAVKADIDEPDRQTVVYKFLRAVLHRKIVITEVYEVMDEVGKVMITNPDQSIRESARSVYLSFVVDYPQGKERWSKQADFLKQNLGYEHATGRQSVMELLHQLLGKIGDDVFQKLGAVIFVPLVLVHGSDSNSSCQEMAAILLARLFERASEATLSSFRRVLDQWRDSEKPAVRTAALRCFVILLRSRSLPKPDAEEMRDQVEKEVSDFTSIRSADGQLMLKALDVLNALLETVPDVALGKDSVGIWSSLESMPLSANADVHEAAAMLLGKYFTDFASTSSKTQQGLSALPLKGSYGLLFDSGDMRRLCATTLRALRTHASEAHETLMAQSVRNLVFLGRCFAANEMQWHGHSTDESEDEADMEEQPSAPQASNTYSALAYLFNRLSAVARQEKFSVPARSAAVQCLAALVNQIGQIPDLQTVLRPLYALTDPSIPKPPGEAHKALVDQAHELLELVQKKVGAENYVAALAVARMEAKARRDDRRQKRRIEAVAAPEKRALEKKKKHEIKKAKQKLKGLEMRAKRRGW